MNDWNKREEPKHKKECVREGSSRELEGIAKLEQEIFGHPWNLESITAFARKTTSDFWVWTENQEVLGYVLGEHVLEDGELHRIAVAKKARGKGIAKGLFAAYTKQYREDGVEQIFLEVREGNKAAIGFYEQNGFVAYGKREGYYRHPKEDALLYRKDMEER